MEKTGCICMILVACHTLYIQVLLRNDKDICKKKKAKNKIIKITARQDTRNNQHQQKCTLAMKKYIFLLEGVLIFSNVEV